MMYWSPHTRDAVVPTEAAAVGRTSTALRKRSCTSLNRGEQQEAPRQRFAACRCRRQHQNVLLLSCTFAAREATRAAHRRPSEAASGAHQRAASARGRRRRRGSSVRSGPRYKVEACRVSTYASEVVCLVSSALRARWLVREVVSTGTF